MIAAREPGRTSWTAALDAVRLGPDHDATEVTATQLRGLVAGLREAGRTATATRTPWWCSTPATTRARWRSCSPICLCRCSGGSARTGCHPGDLHIVEGTLIRLQVHPTIMIGKPLWLWWSEIDATTADVPKIRDPPAGTAGPR